MWDEVAPGEQYCVVHWRGEWQVVRVTSTTIAGYLNAQIASADMPTQESAERAAASWNAQARVLEERRKAGVCACGLPYQEHV